MTFSDNHSEQIHFHVVASPHHPVVLGYTWLRRHNPCIDWSSGEVTEWGAECISTGLVHDKGPGGTEPGTTEPEQVRGTSLLS